jgi:hypothetical protein
MVETPRGATRPILLVTVVIIASSSCALRRAPAQDYGIPPCPAGAERRLLSPDSLQCWLAAPHGRWRRLDQQSHLEALVVFVEARDRRDAVAIAQKLIEDPGASAYSEILLYVRTEDGGAGSSTRRVGWTRSNGFETLDFE